MKAWECCDKNAYTDIAVVVFAETRGKAHSLAMREDAFENAEWTDICVRRIPALDNYFRGGNVLCWDNDEDRIALVRDGGFVCSYEIDYPECEENGYCPARKWCERYEEIKRKTRRNYDTDITV